MLNPSGKPPAAAYDQLEGQVVAAWLTQKGLRNTRGDSVLFRGSVKFVATNSGFST